MYGCSTDPRRNWPRRTCHPFGEMFWVPSPSGSRAAAHNAEANEKGPGGGATEKGHHLERSSSIFPFQIANQSCLGGTV